MSKRILVLDELSKFSFDHKQLLQQNQWSIAQTDSIDEAKHHLLNKQFDPIVIWIIADSLEDEKFAQLVELHEQILHCSWLVVDQSGRYQNLVEGGTKDFAQQSLEAMPSAQRTLDLVERAHRNAANEKTLADIQSNEAKRHQTDAFLGNSQEIKELKHFVDLISKVPVSSLIIVGETGTGKGLLARIVHHSGLRKHGPLVELNCAALPRDLMESELFGHESGAFTGAQGLHKGLIEQANGGTLFLDEISEMDLDLQAKLLKAIEDKRIRRVGGERDIQVDVQFLVATGIDLDAAIKQKHFREDLYHRLNVFCVKIPPLRERMGDLRDLVQNFVAEFNHRAHKQVEIIPDAVWMKLLSYNWPGNIRELRNVLERCVLLASDKVLPAKWLQLKEHCEPDDDSHSPDNHDQLQSQHNNDEISIRLDGSLSLDEMDRYIIQTALERNRYNVTETARVLGTTRQTLRYRIQKYNLKSGSLLKQER